MGPLLLAIVLITGCHQKGIRPLDSPSKANPKAAETIILTSPASAANCENQITRQGAKILHRGTSGLLLVDQSIAELKLDQCGNSAVSNEVVRLNSVPLEKPKPSEASKIDLPTLLRLIPAEEIGARSFIRDNPTFDGRGVTVAILDTGIEVDHPMLTLTSNGERKISDFDDFSGEGRVELAQVGVVNNTIVVEGETYVVSPSDLTTAQFGVFKGSTLKYVDDLEKVDVFSDLGVLVYDLESSNGTARSVRTVRIDTNHNKDFTDEVDLTSFSKAGEFTKIGEKRSLTVSVSVPESGTSINLCFDDGTHGTHVAGIAVGNEPNGLIGVAPGAKVIMGKIGDNRLAGGSTTTASMLLAIDWAVQSGARIINLSYGISAGSNIGKSVIDQYINTVAREKNILFSISAGNEGPGLQTIGTPAGADLAITNGAYLSSKTAQDNYGYLGIKENGLWFFSSVGPRLDGGMKPSLLAPGAAVASVPGFASSYANYRGTSMASPQTTGGLALLLSGASQSAMTTDRVSITRAIYRTAVPVEGLRLAEQGHGLFNIPGAFESLKFSQGEPVIEYLVGVNSPLSPDGTGSGLFIRSSEAPSNPSLVTITPKQLSNTIEVRTFRIKPSAPWIKAYPNLWIAGTPKTFQVEIDPLLFSKPGLHSERIDAIDEVTGQRAFVVPVNVVVPNVGTSNLSESVSIKPGKTTRLFLQPPQGATRVAVRLATSGPTVWGQLLDGEGRKIIELRDTVSQIPQPVISKSAPLPQDFVYELDLTASPANRQNVVAHVEIQFFGLGIKKELSTDASKFDVSITNYMTGISIIPKVTQKKALKASILTVIGDTVNIPISITASDLNRYRSLHFLTTVSKKIYDKMTDFPYRLFDSSGGLLLSGGLAVISEIEIDSLDELSVGDYRLEITGAFTKPQEDPWPLGIQETRILKTPKTPKSTELNRLYFDRGQTRTLAIDLSSIERGQSPDLQDCSTLVLETVDGLVAEEKDFCGVISSVN